MANNEERTTEQIRKQSYLYLNEIWIPKKLLKQKYLENEKLRNKLRSLTKLIERKNLKIYQLEKEVK